MDDEDPGGQNFVGTDFHDCMLSWSEVGGVDGSSFVGERSSCAWTLFSFLDNS